jgi:hypothetical protein
VKFQYHKAITASDEAFLWQVMTFYPSFWKRGLQLDKLNMDDDYSVTGGSDNVTEATSGSASESSISSGDRGQTKKKRGPKKGFKDTAGKTIQAYKDYLTRVGESREAQTKENSKLWSQKLKIIARREQSMRDNVDVIPPVRTIVPMRETVQHFAQYAQIPLGVMDMDFGSDEEETPTATEL